MTTSLALYAFEPPGIPEAVKLAQILVASRLLPRAISTPEAAVTVIMAGRELGLTAMQSLRSIHIIEGKPTMSADLMVALDGCLLEANSTLGRMVGHEPDALVGRPIVELVHPDRKSVV